MAKIFCVVSVAIQLLRYSEWLPCITLFLVVYRAAVQLLGCSELLPGCCYALLRYSELTYSSNIMWLLGCSESLPECCYALRNFE